MAVKEQDIHHLIDRIFKVLLPAHGMAERPEQIALSHKMLNAMLADDIALCDAGTGIGKTFAYLAAGIAFLQWRVQNHLHFMPITISTSSISLQNAIIKDYLPLLDQALKDDGFDSVLINAIVRKGKQHYVCDQRLEHRLKQTAEKKKSKAAANALKSMRIHLDLDSVEALSNYDKERVCVPQVCSCDLSDCRYRAFLHDCETRQYAFQICNHNLLLADAIHRKAGTRRILRNSCAVIIDEAHKLPEASRKMFGLTLNAEDIRELTRKLKWERYYLAADNLSSASKPLLDSMDRPREDHSFSYYAHLLIAPERVLKVIEKQLSEQLSDKTNRSLRDVTAAAETLCSDRPELLFYASENETGGTTLCATVTDLSDRLNQTLWQQPRPFVLTSGTLAVGADFQRFRSEVGLTDYPKLIETVSESPFDYQKNCLLYLPDKANVVEKSNACSRSITDEITALVHASCGHALVLFTSYLAMSSVKERLVQRFLPFRIFTMNRNTGYTVEQFKKVPGSILLATGAAWEGFDFPGDCVSMLIIPRLPFPRPDAIKEKEREQFETLHDYIRAVVVPEMQIKLRQGFGRAIRTETDTCVVAILDERAGPNSRYYSDVISALPEMRQTSKLAEVSAFFQQVKPDSYFIPLASGQAAAKAV